MDSRDHLRLLFASLALSLLLPVRAGAFTGTYTGGAPNFCLPGIDSFDWGDCYNSNFTVAQASISALAAQQSSAASSTTTLYAQLNSTASALTNETDRALASELVLSNSTSSLLGVINSTASALTVETNRATAAEAVLSASTATLNNVKASTGTCSLPNVLIQVSSQNVVCAQPSNVTGTAAALAAAGSTSPSGFVARGVDASGNAINAAVDASAVSGSTNPVQSGGMFTSLAGKLGATASAGGDLTGNYPNPTIAAGKVIGPDVALSTVPLASLNQSGAAANNVIAWNGSAWAPAVPSGGSGGSLISTGTLAASATAFPLRNQMMFDSTFVNLTDTPTANATFITFKNMGGITSMPTRTIFTSGSGTYTVPNGVSMIRVHLWGGGAGANNTSGTSGIAGSSSTWIIAGSTIAANGGGAPTGSNCNGVPGAGGTGGQGGQGIFASSSVVRYPGGGGGGGGCGSGGGLSGGGSYYGGGPTPGTPNNTNGNSASVNTGAGGTSGMASGSAAGGAGGGESVELTINSPAGPYYWTVGAGGAGAAGGTQSGGSGGSGGVSVDEYYGTQGFAAPASSATAIPEITFTGSQYTCLSGSTVTMTNVANSVDVSFFGAMATAGGGQAVYIGALVDGAPILQSGRGQAAFTNTASYFSNVSYTANISVAAGSHSYCLWAWNPSAGNTTLYNDSSAPTNRFMVRESKNASGTGDVSSNGVNKWSGSQAGNFNISGGSVTIGPIVTGSTASWSSVVLGNWSLLASTHPAGSTSLYFYGLLSNSPYSATSGKAEYQLRFNIHQNTSTGILGVRFNDDTTGGAHNYANTGETSGNASNTETTDTLCALSYRSGQLAGTQIVGMLDFANDPTSTSALAGHEQAYFNNANPGGIINQSCGYTGGVSLTNLRVFTSAGTITGDVSLWVMLTP